MDTWNLACIMQRKILQNKSLNSPFQAQLYIVFDNIFDKHWAL